MSSKEEEQVNEKNDLGPWSLAPRAFELLPLVETGRRLREKSVWAS